MCAAWSQANRGELRFRISDPSGAALRSTIELESSANDYHEAIQTDERGRAFIPLLPFGTYQVVVSRKGFDRYQGSVDIHSEAPVEVRVALAVAGNRTEITVTDQGSVVDLDNPFSAMQIGSEQVERRPRSLPGRSVQDLVVSQPGWLYEGNAVLHPRGSEYQTQFVVDGIPLTDNRSPSFGPEIDADDLDSLTIYTGGIPAEYGRKLGGVIELNTRREDDPGLHGNFAVSGGSYDTLSGYGQIEERRKNDAMTFSASGARTDHYLNPVVPENYTNAGTVADFAATYERDLGQNDRMVLSARRELARYLIPNELLQQEAGQRQNGDNLETLGMARYQHMISPNSLLLVSGMLRENAKDLESNRNPTPIAAFQHNRFREGYFRASYAVHRGGNEWKAGVESDATFLHENFRYRITDPTQFSEGTAPEMSFLDERPDLEQAAYIEDLLHIRDWTASLGIRWDHYQLLLNREAFSPRLAVSRAFPGVDMALHGSYDRVFQTPEFENILLSSSAQVAGLGEQFLRLPVEPSSGNHWEMGATKGFANRVRLDVNTYWRHDRNAADDDQLLNTPISYPISFDHCATYGAEGKLQAAGAGPVSGYISYSYMVAKVWFPVTGGLFLGKDVENAGSDLHGHFAATQDQRNTMSTRWEWKAAQRVRFAAGGTYGSGLPFEYDGTQEEALRQYGAEVVRRLNFERGRILPLLAIHASASAEIYRHEQRSVSLQVDGENLNNRLNVMDFGGLFSGNAIAPQRSFVVHLESRF